MDGTGTNMGLAELVDAPDVSGQTGARMRQVVDELAERYQDAEGREAWVVAFSGGKDSTLVVHLVLEALRRVRPSRRRRSIHVVCSDTRVETPAIAEFVAERLSAIQSAAEALSWPVQTHLVRPDVVDTFWVRLIGYGYAPPTRNFRWCTDRLKIKPTNGLMRGLIRRHGGVLVLTGSRFAESSARAQSLAKHTSDGAINPHTSIKGAFVWSPIRDLSTEEVWEYLALTPAPWGGNHRRLQNLYKEANSGECPLVLDETTQPCGNSRFGCWTCTVVKRDRSVEGFIGSGREEYAGLAAFRDWLIELREDEQGVYREKVRRNGQPGNGPLRLTVREEVLRRLLALQRAVGQELISGGEIAYIRQTWVSEALIDVESPGDGPHKFEEVGR